MDVKNDFVYHGQTLFRTLGPYSLHLDVIYFDSGALTTP